MVAAHQVDDVADAAPRGDDDDDNLGGENASSDHDEIPAAQVYCHNSGSMHGMWSCEQTCPAPSG